MKRRKVEVSKTTESKTDYVILKILALLVSLNFSFLSMSETANAFGSRAPGNTEDISLKLPENTYKAESNLDVDKVDPRNGNLEINQKDFYLPGQGLNIEVWRSYNMLSTSAAMASTHNGSYRWADIGLGWSLDVAPKISVKNRFETGVSMDFGYYWQYENYLVNLCTRTVAHDGLSSDLKHRSGSPLVVLELPQGNRQTFYSVGNHVALTKNNWKLECISNQVKVTSPTGIVYDYGDISGRQIGLTFNDETEMYDEITEESPPTQSETYMLANSATDLYGNKLTFTYKQYGKRIPTWPQTKHSRSPGVFDGPWSSDFYGLERNVVLLMRVSANDGRYVDFTRDDSTGRLVRASSSSGRVIEYKYMDHSKLNVINLTKVTYSTGENWEFRYAPGPYITTYYDRIPLSNENATSRKLIGITYPSGGTVSYSYTYVAAQVNVTIRKVGWPLYETSEKVASRTLSTGETWKYSYSMGRGLNYDINQVDGPEGRTVYKYTGNSYNVTTALIGSPNETVWMTGLLMEKIDPLGNSEVYTWSPRLVAPGRDFHVGLGYAMDSQIWAADLSRKKSIFNGLSYVTDYSEYDKFGNAAKKIEQGPLGDTRTTNYAYLNEEQTWQIGLESLQQTGPHAILKEYDGKGSISKVSTDGVTINFSYDNGGNLATKTTPRGYVYTYKNYKLGIARNEVQPEGIQISREVDNKGNILSETNGNGETTKYAYDAMGRLIFEKKPLGNERTVLHTPLGRIAQRGRLIEEIQYSPFGLTASVTLGGIKTSYKYDGYGRKVFESDPGSTYGTTYAYDAAGRISSKIFADASSELYEYSGSSKKVTDGRGNTTTFEYYSYGDPTEQYLSKIIPPLDTSTTVIKRNERDLVSTISQGGFTRRYTYNESSYLSSVEGPEVGLVSYERDLEGNLTSRKLGNITSYFSFDGLNRITSATYSNDTDSINYTYDNTGRLTSGRRKDGDRYMYYDANGNLTSEILITSGVTMAAGYTYNSNDQLTSIKYPITGRIVNYDLDLLGRPLSISGFVSAVSYWPSGLTKKIIHVNGVQSLYGQNVRLWPSSFKVENVTKSQTLLDTNYDYDANGNLKSINDSTDPTLNRIMSYDSINRLIDVQGYTLGGRIEYDEAGNILNQTHGDQKTVYSYDVRNRLSKLNRSSSSSFKYDSMGNLIFDGNNSYNYNATPNLVCINCDSSLAVKYRYDAMNYRRLSVRSQEQTYEMYDSLGRLLLTSVKGKPNLTTEYIYLGDKRVAQRMGEL